MFLFLCSISQLVSQVEILKDLQSYRFNYSHIYNCMFEQGTGMGIPWLKINNYNCLFYLLTYYRRLNVKELLAPNRRDIWSLGDCSETRVQNHLVCKRTLKCTVQISKYSQHSSAIWPVWLNDWLFFYKFCGCGFESRCSQIFVTWFYNDSFILFCFLMIWITIVGDCYSLTVVVLRQRVMTPAESEKLNWSKVN